jgi:hypothetical protein
LSAPRLIDLIAALDTIKRIAERPRGTGLHRGDDLLPRGAVGVDKRVLALVEDRRQGVRTEAGVLADAAIVEDCNPRADVGVAVVRHAIGRLCAGEAHARMGAIAEPLDGRAAAAAERHLRARREALAPRLLQVSGVRHQIGPVERHLNGTTPGPPPAPVTRRPWPPRPAGPPQAQTGTPNPAAQPWLPGAGRGRWGAARSLVAMVVSSQRRSPKNTQADRLCGSRCTSRL